ncbi:MAG: hypothetical protein ACI4E1_08685 [Lachnospira sp.]
MQVKTTNRQKSAVSLMITLTTIMAALLTFITVSKTVPGETIPGDYRDNANAVISRGDDMASFSSSLTSISNLDGLDMEKTINTLIAGFRRDTISIKAAIVLSNPYEVVQVTEADNTQSYIFTVETDIFEENVTNPNQLCAYMMNTSATEMYDGREIYSVRELTILPENVNSQRARTIGNVSIKLPSPKQVIILDYRRTSQTEPVTTTATETTTTATVAPPTQPDSTTSSGTVPEVHTTSSQVTTTATEQSTTQSVVKPTAQPAVQPTATTKSTPHSPASDSCEEAAPVMGERAFYN